MCIRDRYSTNADFFRASASAQSGDATASKKKAVIAARTAITSQIKAKAEMASSYREAMERRSMWRGGMFIELSAVPILLSGSRLRCGIFLRSLRSDVYKRQPEQVVGAIRNAGLEPVWKDWDAALDVV